MCQSFTRLNSLCPTYRTLDTDIVFFHSILFEPTSSPPASFTKHVLLPYAPLEMTTRDVVLRQHLLNGNQRSYTVRLSLDDTVISYGIYPQGRIEHQDGPFDLEQFEQQNTGCAAAIHTENGHICVEALAASVQVQSFASGFDGRSANGCMQLKASTPPGQRVFLQLHPGESIYVGPLSLSIVPQEHAQFPVLSSPYTASRYDSYVEQVSQAQTSSLSMIKPERSLLDTPLTARHYMVVTPDQTGSSKAFNSTLHSIGNIADRSPEIPTSIRHNHPQDGSASIRDRTRPRGRKLDHAISHPNRSLFGGGHSENGPHPQNEPHPDINHDDTADKGPESEQEDDKVPGPEATRTQQKSSYSESKPLAPELSVSNDTQGSMLGTIRVNMLSKNPPKGCISRTQAPMGDGTTSRLNERTPTTASSKKMNDNNASPATLDSSMRSTRSAVRSVIKVVFASSSTIAGSKHFMKFMRSQGVLTVESIHDCTFLCIGKGELKKTSKMIMATLFGKQIITDDWVVESARAKRLLETHQYLAKDKKKEAEWGAYLDEAIERGTRGVKPFQGWTIAFTQTAKKDAGEGGFDELKELAIMAGAKQVSGAMPKKSAEETPNTLIIASINDPSLAQFKSGWRCFVREIIGISILRGILDTSSDEFLVQLAQETKGSSKRKR
ncbi:MAG: hypothetical protein Q9164_004672 [Protoblastenia rupestris]